ncbi:DUF3108 domain-containing protein [Luteimonas saliphila]|uniref:DUF3108 domain-containing protein n=1 Tax=Luteimonas saliphila TaxID=2804919 RepID=UPI00192D2637|nr:DUF3108 domain-containing protein [Luteimonas saliphila]
MRNRLAALLLAVCGAVFAAPADAALKPFTAQYSAKYKGVPASGVMVLAPRGSQWALAMSLENVAASMSQATFFTESRSGMLMPLGGADRTSYVGQRKSVPAKFDWKSMQASWSGDAKRARRGPVAIRAGDVDGLLLQLALARDVAAGKPLDYRVVENGKARPMRFRRVGIEAVTVNGRTMQATRVVSSSNGKTTSVWIAAGVPVPVRLVQAEGGSETVSLRLTSWK